MPKLFANWTEEKRYEAFQELGKEFAEQWEKELEEKDEGATITHISKYETEAVNILNNDKPTGIMTGYYYLDDKIKGFDDGELIVVSGSTGTGKTLFALNCILNSMSKNMNPCLIFTLEMTKPQITARIIQILKADSDKLKIEDLPIFYYASKNEPTIKRINKAVQEMKEKHGIAWVMIDHLHYFSRSIQNQVAELGVLTRDIKRMAVNEKLPVILLAQPKKKSGNDEPELDDIKGASDITQDADTVIQLSRDMMDEKKDHILNVYVTKNRNKGSLGKIEMEIKPKTFRLREFDYVH